MQIPQYTQGLVKERATPDAVNFGEIIAAGAEARAVADVANITAEIATQMQHANDLTRVNAAIIKKQKDDLDFQAQARKESESSPMGFAKRVEAEYEKRDEEILKGLDNEQQRAAFKSTSSKYNLRSYEENFSWENKRSTEMFANRADESISDLEVMAYRGVPLDQLSKDRQATMLTLGAVLAPDQIAKFDQKAEQRITSSFLEGKIDSNPYEAKKLLDSKQYDNALGADALSSFYNQTEDKIRSLERAALADQERNIQIQAVNNAVNGEAILDPYNKATKKAVDTYYDQLTAKMGDMEPEEQRQVQVELVSRTGVYPDKMKSNISAQLNNGTPQQKVEAAELIDAISIAKPATIEQITQSQRAKSRAITQGVNAGMNPAKAVELAEKNAYERNTPEYKVRLAKFRDEKVKFSKGSYTEFFRNDPDNMPDSMEADYNTLNQNYYMSGLDPKEAASLAEETVKANWAVTNADGTNRWMKYAPETVYGNQAGTEWIQRQLKEDLAQIPSLTASGKEPEIYLSVDPRTIRSPEKQYRVYMKSETGELQPYLTQSGEQAIFRPDYEQSKDFIDLVKKYNGDKDEAMKQAIRMRDRQVFEQEKRNEQKRIKLERSRAFKEGVEGTLNSVGIEGLFSADN